jgi:hypothetical protein
MALEILKGIKEIGGYEVAELVEFADKRPEQYVVVNHKNNGINFKIQDGPIKEVGVNGCQVDTLIEAAKIIIEGLNEKFPCRENAIVITKLDESLLWLLKRKLDREKRNVEGFNKK